MEVGESSTICLLETSQRIFRRGRFAFNRDPRPTYTAACVLSRYEFIVYTERPPVHIRKLIVQAVNYSACTPATAAAVPHVCCVQALFHAYTCIFAMFRVLASGKNRENKRKRREIFLIRDGTLKHV